eukprot:719975-Pelagomonas_calceolata.AAC.5
MRPSRIRGAYRVEKSLPASNSSRGEHGSIAKTKLSGPMSLSSKSSAIPWDYQLMASHPRAAQASSQWKAANALDTGLKEVC